MRVLWLLFSLLAGCFAEIELKDVPVACIYDVEEFKLIGSVYTCEIERSYRIAEPRIRINVSGHEHQPDMSDRDVVAFKIDVHRLKYFPLGINDSFPAVRVIYINDGLLQFLYQSDLQPFSDLHTLDLHENQLESLDADVFRFNERLEVLWLSDNRLYQLHPLVFAHLSRLSYLYLMNNFCVSRSARDSRTDVEALIREASAKCAFGEMTTPRPRATISDSEDDGSDEEWGVFRRVSEREREREDDDLLTLKTFFDELEEQRERYSVIVFLMSVAIFVMATALVGTCWFMKRNGAGGGAVGGVSMQRLLA